MAHHPHRFGFARSLGPAMLLGLAAAACDSGTSTATSKDAQPVCPADVPSTIGAPCGPNLTCAPEYSCGIFMVTASCACVNGQFACTDVTGQPLTAGATPACPAPDAAESCPASETTARTVSCTLSGLQCAYPTTCAIERDYDSCQCFPVTTPDGGTSLRFSCPDPCVDAALVEDASAPDAPEETSPPPPAEASAPDAPVTDAPHDAPSTPPDAQIQSDAKPD